MATANYKTCIHVLFGTYHGRDRDLDAIRVERIGRIHLSFCKEWQYAVTCASGIKPYLSLALPGIVIEI